MVRPAGRTYLEVKVLYSPDSHNGRHLSPLQDESQVETIFSSFLR